MLWLFRCDMTVLEATWRDKVNCTQPFLIACLIESQEIPHNMWLSRRIRPSQFLCISLDRFCFNKLWLALTCLDWNWRELQMSCRLQSRIGIHLCLVRWPLRLELRLIDDDWRNLLYVQCIGLNAYRCDLGEFFFIERWLDELQWITKYLFQAPDDSLSMPSLST